MTSFTNEPWAKSCLQVYTGNGKGKTTAAFGLALRAAGRGMKVFIGQFMKGSQYGELEGVKMLDGLVDLEQFGSPECIPFRPKPNPTDVALAEAGLKRSREILASGDYAIVILDEICVAVHFELVTEADLLEMVDSRPDNVELICTGRYAPQALIERADLVSEMNPIKHPYDTIKLSARDGIER